MRSEFLRIDFLVKVSELSIKGDTNNTLYEVKNKITSQKILWANLNCEILELITISPLNYFRDQVFPGSFLTEKEWEKKEKDKGYKRNRRGFFRVFLVCWLVLGFVLFCLGFFFPFSLCLQDSNTFIWNFQNWLATTVLTGSQPPEYKYPFTSQTSQVIIEQSCWSLGKGGNMLILNLRTLSIPVVMLWLLFDL